MKEKIYIYFIGTAGSGKSTLTNFFKLWLEMKSLDSITINLDPGAENLPYIPDIDIRDWISLDEVMKKYGLGPNGAQIACADMIALNSEDIKISIESYKSDYILIDTPGQLELFAFRESGKYIIDYINKNRSLVAYLIDYSLANNPSSYISQMLLSLNTNFKINLPQMNILSKSDLLNDKDRNKILSWSKNKDELFSAVENQNPSIYREMNEKILQILNDFENTTRLIPTGKDFYGIDDLYNNIQIHFYGGEDLLKD
jgi:GTPase SAR1 family protein